MQDDDIEIVTNEGNNATCSHSVPKRQITLDAFLFGGQNRSVVICEKPNRKKAKNNRKSITVTRSATPKGDFNRTRKSFGIVVEEVERNEEQSFSDWARMSNVMEQAKAKADRSTLKQYVKVGPHQEHFNAYNRLAVELDSIRCFEDMWPSLDNRMASDVVLISTDSMRQETPPEPIPPHCLSPTYGWNFGRKYVRLPFSICNVVDGIPRFDAIQSAISDLLEPLTSYKQIERCIRCYTRNKRFDALELLFDTVLDKTLRAEYLAIVVPFMAKLAMQSPTLITQPIPLLRRGNIGSVTMSQQQAASLLAHAFFCTFPSRNDVSRDLPLINFNRLFAAQTANVVEKLRCIFHYFHMISKKMPTGLLTFRRQRDSMPRWSSMNVPLSKLYVSPTGTIEDDGHGMLQVDFANEYIGGGVLSNGCVQEEIRFLIYPEMIVSMLLCEKMDNNEAIVICGAERFSDYEGYSSSFRWRRMREKDSTPRDRYNRLCNELVAIDAQPYYDTHDQFNIEMVNRELLKAYVGFAVNDGTAKPVATGNWGCGAYGGDLDLKSMIQLMASSARKRPLCYFTFGDREFSEDFNKMYKLLIQAGVTVGQLYDMVSDYCASYDRNNSPRLFDYLSMKTKENMVSQEEISADD